MNLHQESVRRATEHLTLGKPGERLPMNNNKEPFKLDEQDFKIWKAFEA